MFLVLKCGGSILFVDVNKTDVLYVLPYAYLYNSIGVDVVMWMNQLLNTNFIVEDVYKYESTKLPILCTPIIY